MFFEFMGFGDFFAGIVEGGVHAVAFLKDAAQAARDARKPLLFCVAAGTKYEPYCAYAQELGLPVFRSADRAVKVYGKYLEYVIG